MSHLTGIWCLAANGLPAAVTASESVMNFALYCFSIDCSMAVGFHAWR